jgi:dehydrogenase/reductase SDR family protein 7B
VPTLVQKIVQKYPKIDVIINNAGVTQRSLAKETTIETTEKLFALDFFSPIYLTQLLFTLFERTSKYYHHF